MEGTRSGQGELSSRVPLLLYHKQKHGPLTPTDKCIADRGTVTARSQVIASARVASAPFCSDCRRSFTPLELVLSSSHQQHATPVSTCFVSLVKGCSLVLIRMPSGPLESISCLINLTIMFFVTGTERQSVQFLTPTHFTSAAENHESHHVISSLSGSRFLSLSFSH